MNRKLLRGILIVLGIAVAFFQPLISGLLAVGCWIYLMWMVRKRKNNMFNNQMEPKIAKRLLKRMKTFLIVAGFSFLVFIFGAIMHNVLHGVSEIEETTFFFIALVALLVFIVATAGSMVIFLKERQKTI